MKWPIESTAITEVLLLSVLLSGVLIGYIQGGPADMEESIYGPRGACGTISHKGGAIRMFRELTTKNGTNKTRTTGEISVMLTELKELNAQFAQVTDSEKRVHAVSTLSDHSFSCAHDKNRKLSFSDVTGNCLSCSTFLKNFNNTELRISSCITTKNGTIVQDDETTYVKEGQLKITVEINNWTWCNANCTGGAGQFLDLDIGVKIPTGDGRAFKKEVVGNMTDGPRQQPTKYTLGAGAAVQFSNKVHVDGVCKNVTAGYPLFSVKGGMNVVTLRFPQFKDRMIYDPTIETGDAVYVPGAHSLSAPSDRRVGMSQTVVYLVFSAIVGMLIRKSGFAI